MLRDKNASFPLGILNHDKNMKTVKINFDNQVQFQDIYENIVF